MSYYIHTKHTKPMTQETVFQALLKTRIAMYELMDLGLITDNDIDSFEGDLLSDAGIDYDVYQEWKS